MKEFDFSKNVLLPPTSTTAEDSQAFDKYSPEFIHNLFSEVVNQKKESQEESNQKEEDDDDVSDELKKDFVDEQTGEKPTSSQLANKSPKKPSSAESKNPLHPLCVSNWRPQITPSININS